MSLHSDLAFRYLQYTVITNLIAFTCLKLLVSYWCTNLYFYACELVSNGFGVMLRRKFSVCTCKPWTELKQDTTWCIQYYLSFRDKGEVSLQSLTGKYRENPVMKTGTLQWEQGYPVMKAGFSLWELTYRELSVSLTGFGFTVWSPAEILCNWL